MTSIVEWQAGDLTVLALSDATGVYQRPLREIFPGAGDEEWQGAGESPWHLDFRCFLVRDSGATMLVDTGLGPSSDWSPEPGRLPGLLDEAGVTPDDITRVLLTHLHTDHIGWAVVDGEPTFPEAEYLLQRAEFDAVQEHYPWLPDTLIGPLLKRDQLRLLDGRTTLDPGITALPTPGHTPGHQSVLITGGRGDDLVLTGDVVQHAVQLRNPAISYDHDADPEQARRTRRELLARGGVLGTAHLTTPFVPAGGTGSGG
ncbi:MBL fold metallo-hydrolase [Actinoplanes sp. G11-F43]|uniref:MBL fold metallo-hydrolase n=1 Tax=Actinoplanes sp. G11-F43 TaxID=3424130 RepID=UPI003D33DCEA